MTLVGRTVRRHGARRGAPDDGRRRCARPARGIGHAPTPVRRRGPLARVLRIGAPDLRRFLLGTGLGTAAALCTVGLLACSGALIDKAALRPPLYTLTVLMAAVQLLALGRGPLRYAERLVSHDAALGALGRVRLWLYDQIAPRSPAGVAGWSNGDLLARATADVDLLQDLYLRGVGPLVAALVTAVVAVGRGGLILPAGGLVMAVCLVGGTAGASGLAWARRRRLGAGEGALRGALVGRRGRTAVGRARPGGHGSGRGVPRAGAGVGRRTRAPGPAALVVRRGVSAVVVVPPPGPPWSGPWWWPPTPSPPTASRLHGGGAAAGGPRCLRRGAAGGRRRVPHGGPRRGGRRLRGRGRPPGAGARTPSIRRRARRTAPTVALEDAVLRYGPEASGCWTGSTSTCPEGRRVAIVGPSGAGKSSVVNVLLRFWGLEAGAARLGGTSLDDLSQDDVRAD